MADRELRELERRAAAGDAQAAEELRARQRRAGQGCERCGEPHPLLCPGGELLEEAARQRALIVSERQHPMTWHLERMRPDCATRQRHAAARVRAYEDQLTFLRRATSGPHRWGDWPFVCGSCRAFEDAHDLPREGAFGLYNEPVLGTWRSSACRLVAIARLVIPRGLSPKATRAALQNYRLDVPRSRGRGGTSHLNKVWQEEVRKAFPELARPWGGRLVPGEVPRAPGPGPLFGGTSG